MSKLRPRKGKSLTLSHTAVSGRTRIRIKTGDSKSSARPPHTACSLTGHTLADSDIPVSQEWGCPSPPTGAARLSGLIDTKIYLPKGHISQALFFRVHFSLSVEGHLSLGLDPRAQDRPGEYTHSAQLVPAPRISFPEPSGCR